MPDDVSQLNTSLNQFEQFLVATMAGELTDSQITAICDEIIQRAHIVGSAGVVLNFAMVRALDSYTYYAFLDLTRALRLIGADVVWAGLRPGVICALFDLGVKLDAGHYLSAINLEAGLKLLQARYSAAHAH